MSKDKTPSFILELPMVTTPSIERKLLTRLEAARHLYNACLSESTRRFELMRQSVDYQKAVKLPAENRKERAFAFTSVREKYGFKDSAIQSYGIKTKNSCHIKDHLDAHTAQKVASRAFTAVNNYAVHKRGRPRFKGKEQFDSLESKTNSSGIKYRDGHVEWNSLRIPCIIDSSDAVIQHGLSCPIKFNRIVRRKINNKNRFYLQIVLEGKPYQKYSYSSSLVGLDIGPSTVAWVSDSDAGLNLLCDGIKTPNQKQIRRLQRKLDRQRRANNPGNYNTDGTVKRGAKKWNKSKREVKIQSKLSTFKGKEKAHRKTLLGELSNKLLIQGKFIKSETDPIKEWQQGWYGKIIGLRAPGTLISKLTYKAESAGGWVKKVPVEIGLSNICICGRKAEKPLKERWHVCECGVIMQRDLFSAYLARYVEDNTLNTSMAYESWRGLDSVLKQAVLRVEKTISGRYIPSSFGLRGIPEDWR